MVERNDVGPERRKRLVRITTQGNARLPPPARAGTRFTAAAATLLQHCGCQGPCVVRALALRQQPSQACSVANVRPPLSSCKLLLKSHRCTVARSATSGSLVWLKILLYGDTCRTTRWASADGPDPDLASRAARKSLRTEDTAGRNARVVLMQKRTHEESAAARREPAPSYLH